MIHFILGFSSAGKSTYIHSLMKSEFKGLPIYLANELNSKNYRELLNVDCVVHYNILRPFKNSSENLHVAILSDPVVTYLLEYSDRIEARILAVPLPLLSQRILLRDIPEPLLKKQSEHSYPREKIFQLVHRVNYLEVHNDWVDLIQGRNIKFEIILTDALTGAYKTTKMLSELNAELRNEDSVRYNKSQIESILSSHKFEYQQINIAGHYKTTGSDRSKTFEEIKAKLNFTNKTVLDIGCAYGYFCFESEKLQARSVVGTELKSHRFIGSNIIKQLTGSKCSFIQGDIFDGNYSKQSDIVLLLNVIHHLSHPIKSLEIAASLAKEVLILEFPTLSDKKFLSTLRPGAEIDASLPLIGVSSLEGQDQTFVFTQEAVKRILLVNNKYFKNIEFIKSPISDTRLLAFCYK